MRRIYLFILALFILPVFAKSYPAPMAEKRPYITITHQDTLRDDWYWLRDREDTALKGVLKSEARYSRQQLKGSARLSRQLFKAMKKQLASDSKSYPFKKDGYYYYSKSRPKDLFPRYFRIKDAPGAKEEIYLDENKMARGHAYFDLANFSIHEDGINMAYIIDYTGDEDYRLYFKNLITGKESDTGISGISEIMWLGAGRRLLFSRINERHQTDSVWYWDIDNSEPVLLYREQDPAFDLSFYKSSDKQMLFLSANSKDTNEIRYFPAKGDAQEMQLFALRQPGHRYWPDFYRGNFYIQSNLTHPDDELYRCSPEDTRQEAWEKLISKADLPSIESFLLCDSTLVVLSRENGFKSISLHSLKDGAVQKRLAQSQPQNLWLLSDESPENPSFYYYSESDLDPYSIYHYDIPSGKEKRVFQSVKPKGYHPEKYETKLLYVPAEDGAFVPLTLKYRKNLDLSQPQSTLLSAYGAYGDSEDPYFSFGDIILMNQGIILATAHPRGGGEYGYKWYEAGKMLNKMNTFTDFIACARHLIAKGYTDSQHLAISGGSAGGLLIAAVLNMAPELFAAAHLDVPFVDALNTMLDDTL
ncbi:MAG: prolyl oligopeptidase family serine peptidase, partial [Candidatus Cloacimonadaceae bacterium]